MMQSIEGLKSGKATIEVFKDFLTAVFLIPCSVTMSLWVFRENFSGLFKNGIPLAGDGLLTGLYIKSVEKSEYLSLMFQNVTSTQYGWPGKLDFTSYPVGNTQEMLAIKIFMDLTGIIDPSQIIHVFSILKAGPIAIATFILARVLGINRALSAIFGLIFAFNTYNLIRAEGHFFLALTWPIPLGLAAIFIAFNQAISYKNPTRKITGFALLLSAFAFMTGFYYSFFLVIFSSVSIIFLFLRLIQENLSQKLSVRIKSTFKLLSLPLLILTVFLLGLILQIAPTLLRGISISKLTGLADRSITESVIYSGTPESLLFNFYSLGLRILNRPDLIAYLQTRISWESSQVGALSGAILIALLILFLGFGLSKLLLIQQIRNSYSIKIDNSMVFVVIMLSTSLLLYFVSPINFTISRILPQIRAWGRLSVLISLISLMLLGLVLSRLKKSNFMIYSLVSIITIIPILEYNQYRISRPLSIDLNNANILQNEEIKLTLLDLKSNYNKNCPLVNLPLYPFPEFDRADDKNIDYGQLQLSILDEGYFRWSYGGIKATENFRTWQPLVSEFPPFARVSIAEQISYGSLVNACGALIDRSYLTQGENLDLQALLKDSSVCVSELDGPLIENQARYVTAKYRDVNCRLNSSQELKELALDSFGKTFVWRVDQPSEFGFEDSYQMFPSSTPINIRLRAASPNSYSSLILRFKIVSDNLSNDLLRSLKISNLENGETQIYRIKFDSQGLSRIELPTTLITGELERITLTLSGGETGETGEIDRWGIQLGAQN